MSTKPRDVKVVLLGDTAVGKTAIAMRFRNKTFGPTEPTLGAAFMVKLMNVNGDPLKFQIWDTAGQEQYHSLAPMYYRGAAIAIVVYDVTDSSSFESLKTWANELKELGPPDTVLGIVGNKIDLPEKRVVDIGAAKAFAAEIGAKYFETSAKDDIGVNEVFLKLARQLPPPQAALNVTILPTAPQTEGANKKKCCK